ncbi:MAG: DUF5312 family protein [Treponemataceae bacterium]
MSNTNSFDRMVLGLTNAERIELLRKIESSSDPEIQNIKMPEDKSSLNFEKDLNIRIKQEPFFLRIWLKIVALLSSASLDYVYNKYLLRIEAHTVGSIAPDLIDYKKQIFLPLFCEKIRELKSVALFFRSSISVYNENEGAFYAFLGSIAIPDLAQRLENESNPYQFPMDREVTSELRTSLIRRMDEVLQTIPPAQKSQMYNSIQALEWLNQFVRLPFERFFSKINESNVCKFSDCESEIEIFANVLCNGKNIPTEILEALFLFSFQSKQESEKGHNRKKSNKTESLNEDESVDPKISESLIHQNCENFVQKSIMQISTIKDFISNVPIRKLTVIAKNLFTWEPEFKIDAEDWFLKFKSHWKKIFDSQWERWLADKKKYQIRETLKKNFATEDFPVIENRPWAAGDGLEFSKEYTLGYLFAFYKKLYPAYNKILKIIMIEGQFSSQENQNEFTDAYNNLNHVEQSIIALNNQLSPKGSLGSAFAAAIEKSLRTIQGYSKIKSMLGTVEAEVINLTTQFINAGKSMSIILDGILTEQKTSRYDALTNLNSIQGDNNEKFKQQIKNTRSGLLEAIDMIKQVEIIGVKSIKEF